MTIVTLEMVEAFMSSPVVVDTMDDDNDGTIDTPVIEQLISFGEAKLLATLRGLYELPLVGPIDPYVQLLTLQIIHCLAVKRFPERFRAGLKVCEDVDAELAKVRSGEVQLNHALRSDAASPEAWSNPPRRIHRGNRA